MIRSTLLAAFSLIALRGPTVDADDHSAKRLDIAKGLVAQMAAGQFEKAVEPFDPIMKRALPGDKLKEVWDGLTKQYGTLQRANETTTEKVQQYEVVYVTCEFQRGKLDAKVVFTPENKITGLFFVPSGRYKPPSYADLSKFEEKEISVGKGTWRLPGTLSLPKGVGPFPAVILVHGSGPHDRDETIGPNKPFRDLAHGLASRGIAVLRFEKRTKEHPIMMAMSVSTITIKEETVDDAVAAVEALASQERIDPKRIFVLGHSLGGMLIPRIGKAAPRIAGFISLAGSTRPLEDLVLEQTRYILSLDGTLSPEAQKKLKEIEQQIAKVKSATLSKDTPMSELPLGVPATYWLDLRGYDPANAAKELRKPMLILQGERDYQVTMEDFANWKKALGSRKDVPFISYSSLNHLFVEGKGKSVPAEYSVPGNVAKVVIDDIANWIEGLHIEKNMAIKEDTEPPTFDIKTKKPADQIKVKIEKGTATIEVSSQSGIGGATVTLTEGKWPTTVVLRLHLSGMESLTISNGKIKLSASVLSHSGHSRLLAVVEDGKEKKVEKGSPYWTEVRAFDSTGKPVPGLPGSGGYFEITLPKALLEGQPKSLNLEWIDFYRK